MTLKLSSLLTRYRVTLISLTAIAAGLILMLVSGFFTGRYNTDDVAQQTLLQNININDGEVVKATASGYAIKFPFYMLMNWLLPNTDFTILITNAFLLLSGVLITFGVFVFLRTAGNIQFRHMVLLPLFLAVVMLHGAAGAAHNPNYRNIEIGLSFLISAASLLFLYRKETFLVVRKLNKFALAVLVIAIAIALGFFWFSDPMFLYYTGIPIGIAAVAQFVYFHRNEQERILGLVALLTLGLSYAFYKLWVIVFAEIFEWSVRPTLGGLISIGDLPHTLWLSLNAFLALTSGGLDVFKVESLPNMLIAVLGTVIVVGGLVVSACLFINELRMKKKASNILILFFSAIPFVMIGIFIVSGTVVDNASMRYLLLVPFTVVFNTALFLNHLQSRGNALQKVTIVISSALVLTLAGQAVGDIVNKPTLRWNDSVDRKVLTLLKQENLQKGYAASGVAHYYNFSSDNTLNIVPTACSPKRLGIFYLLMDDASLKEPASRSFYLSYPEAISNKCTSDDIIYFIGEPNRTVQGPKGIQILIYNHDIRDDIFKAANVQQNP